MILNLGPVDIAALTALWTVSLWGSSMRSARTLVVLAAFSAMYIVATAIPQPLSISLRVSAILVPLAIFYLAEDRFVTMSRADRDFDRAYWKIRERLRKLSEERLAGALVPWAYAEEVRQLIPAFEGLDPPSDDWRVLRDDTVGHLNLQVSRYQQAARGEYVGDLAAGASDIEMLRKRYLELRAAKTQFW